MYSLLPLTALVMLVLVHVNCRKPRKKEELKAEKKMCVSADLARNRTLLSVIKVLRRICCLSNFPRNILWIDIFSFRYWFPGHYSTVPLTHPSLYSFSSFISRNIIVICHLMQLPLGEQSGGLFDTRYTRFPIDRILEWMELKQPPLQPPHGSLLL